MIDLIPSCVAARSSGGPLLACPAENLSVLLPIALSDDIGSSRYMPTRNQATASEQSSRRSLITGSDPKWPLGCIHLSGDTRLLLGKNIPGIVNMCTLTFRLSDRRDLTARRWQLVSFHASR